VIRFFLIAVVLLTMSGCNYYNRYVKKGFPIDEKDQVIVFAKKHSTGGPAITTDVDNVVVKTAAINQAKVGSRVHVEGYQSSAIAVVDNAVIVGDPTGDIFCVDKYNLGRVIWKSSVKTDDRISTGIHIEASSDVIFITANNSYVFALNKKNGDLIWKTKIMGATRGPILNDNNRSIYVLTNENRVYSLDYKTGNVLWLTQAIETRLKDISSPSGLITNDNFLLLNPNGDINFFNKKNGFNIKTINKGDTDGAAHGLPSDILAVPGSDKFVVLYNGTISSVSSDGRALWTHPIRASMKIVVTKTNVLAVDNNDVIYSIDIGTGKILWQNKINNKIRGLAWHRENIFVFVKKGSVLTLDPRSGVCRGRVIVDNNIESQPAIAEDTIYMYNSRKARIYSLNIF
jgi:outer membrane protein assembly factor BamB